MPTASEYPGVLQHRWEADRFESPDDDGRHLQEGTGDDAP